MFPLQPLLRELPQILPVFAPILLSQYAGIANGLVDTAMTARLGTLELGSVAVGVAVWVPVNLFSMGVLYGMLMLISRRYGAGDDKGVRETAHQGIWIGLALGGLSALAVRLLSYRLGWFGVASELVAPAGEYMRMVAVGLPFLSMAIAMRFFCEGQKVLVPITVMSILMVGINALLNYGLMFGKLGLPNLGLRGCGMATTASCICFLAMLAIFIRFAPNSAGRTFFQRLYMPNRLLICEILKIGVPIGLAVTSEYLVFTVITLLIATLGAVPAAAHQVCFSVMMLLFATPRALSVAASIRVGTLLGKGDSAALREAIVGIMLLGAFMGLAFTAVMALGAEPLLRLFTTDSAVLPLAIKVLLVAAFFQLADSLQICLNGTLRGAGDTVVPFYLTTLAYWLLCLPLGYLLAGLPLLGGLGLSPEVFGIRGWWMALTVSISLVSVLLAFRVRRIFWARRVSMQAGSLETKTEA